MYKKTELPPVNRDKKRRHQRIHKTYLRKLHQISVHIYIFKLRGQKASHDGHTDIVVDIYSCTFMK